MGSLVFFKFRTSTIGRSVELLQSLKIKVSLGLFCFYYYLLGFDYCLLSSSQVLCLASRARTDVLKPGSTGTELCYRLGGTNVPPKFLQILKFILKIYDFLRNVPPKLKIYPKIS